MKEFDEYGLRLCRFQANVFEASREKTDCSSAIFLRRFMLSDAARRFDTNKELYGAADVGGILEEIEEEFGPSKYGRVKYASEELYWIGYIYRYWCYTREITSRRVYRIIKPAELRSLYYAYHTLDPAAAVERIMEAKGIRERDYLKEGVTILRRLMAKRLSASISLPARERK